MNGSTLIALGAVIIALGIVLTIVSIIYEVTTAKRVKKQLKAEYLD